MIPGPVPVGKPVVIITVKWIHRAVSVHLRHKRKLVRQRKSGCHRHCRVRQIPGRSLFGRINLNVYSTGRDLQQVGVIPGEDMLSEVATVKLKWVLGQTRDPEEAREMMLRNYAGEITERTMSDAYYPQYPQAP